MAHDFVKEMIGSERGHAGAQITIMLAGGFLLITSMGASLIFAKPFYGGIVAMVAAVLLGTPLVLQAVRDLWRGRTEMNELAALVAGHISIAMGAAGSDVAIHSASIALMNNELNRIPFLVHLSRRTMSVIRQNLTFAIGYIVILLGLTLTAGLSFLAFVLGRYFAGMSKVGRWRLLGAGAGYITAAQ